MTDLVDAYQRREVHSAEKILRGLWIAFSSTVGLNLSPIDNRATIMEDPFIRLYIDELLRSLRTQYLIDLIKPYTRLELSFLAKVHYPEPQAGYSMILTPTFKQLNVEINDVEELLIGLILEGKVEGRIDQVAMRLELDRK